MAQATLQTKIAIFKGDFNNLKNIIRGGLVLKVKDRVLLKK